MTDTPETPDEPQTPPEPPESGDQTWQQQRHDQSYPNAEQPAGDDEQSTDEQS